MSGARGMKWLSHAARAPLLESKPPVPRSWAKPRWWLFLCSAFTDSALSAEASPTSPKLTPCHPDAVRLGRRVSVLGSCRWFEPLRTTAGSGLCLQPAGANNSVCPSAVCAPPKTKALCSCWGQEYAASTGKTMSNFKLCSSGKAHVLYHSIQRLGLGTGFPRNPKRGRPDEPWCNSELPRGHFTLCPLELQQQNR